MENKLREIRKSLGLTLEQVGEPMGVKASQVEKLEKNQRKMTVQWLERLEKSFLQMGYNVSASEIIGVSKRSFEPIQNSEETKINQINLRKQLPLENKIATIAENMAPVVGYIGAGLTIYPITDKQGGYNMVSIPKSKEGALDASTAQVLIIEGDNSFEPFLDGDKVFFEVKPGEPVQPECLGRLCVIKVKGDGLYIRRLSKGSEKGKYHLKLPHHRELLNRDVEWASKILFVEQD